ncbi:MAG: four helix bundle protein [Bacteroidetes bacterium]|nr:MAG: four helix bundle protein [Bacteroidota bacterium]
MNSTGNAQIEKHTFLFAQAVRNFVKSLPPTISNIEDTKMLVRTSGLVGEKYLRANESVSKKDFLVGMKSCCAEAKASFYWLNLLDTQSIPELEEKRQQLIKVATELVNVFSAVLTKAQA